MDEMINLSITSIQRYPFGYAIVMGS